MRVGVINNGEKEPQNILALLTDHEVKVFDYTEAGQVDTADFNFLVLSGSSQFPVMYHQDKLSDEIALVRRADIPLLGICFGMQVMVVAYGGTLRDMGADAKCQRPIAMRVTTPDPIFAWLDTFMAHDSHRWTIDTIPIGFDIIAESDHGIEAIKHQEKLLYGVQFHPEKRLEETQGKHIFESFVRMAIV